MSSNLIYPYLLSCTCRIFFIFSPKARGTAS
jgi:hypothetical protein